MDADGNIYKTVQIGDQIWMAENLKVIMYSDKTPIPYVEDSASWFHFTRESLGYCWYENVLTHGYGYVWYRELDYDTSAVYRDYSGVYRGHSVRCVKDVITQLH